MTRSLDSLIEFRRKLVRAKSKQVRSKNRIALYHLIFTAGLDGLVDKGWGTNKGGIVRWDWVNWYDNASRSECLAMWDNSIRNVDRMIEELK